VLSLTIPATAGLILLAEPIIRLIFEHGAFTSVDTARTAEALTFYAVGLFAYSAVKIMVPVFYALGSTRYPVIGSFLAVGANILFIVLTIDLFQHRAIALATSCSMTLNFLFLGLILSRKLEGFSPRPLLTGACKILLATGVMTGAVWLLSRLLAPWLHGAIFLQLLGVLGTIGAGAIIYYLALTALKLPELTVITEKIVRRLRGSEDRRQKREDG
jgi:putative peptidoglycan lipid II flippase